MLKGAFRALFVLALALGVAGYVGIPLLERRLTFFPVPADPARPWTPPAGAQDVFFDSAPGVALHGWYWRADPAKPASITILYSHGNANNVVPFAPEAARLAAAGFDVLLFDYRGYGRSAGTSEARPRWSAMAAQPWTILYASAACRRSRSPTTAIRWAASSPPTYR